MPFSSAQLHDMARQYNLSIEPLQILIFIPTLLIFALLLRGTKQDTSRGVLLLLGAEWGVVGVLFFLNVMARSHWVGSVLGIFYLAACLFYAGAAARSFPPHFHWRADTPSFVSFAITAASAVLYPLFSLALGRSYPHVMTYSLMPGPVALLTLGVLMSARPAPRVWLMVPPLVIAALSPVAVFAWGVWEDLLLMPPAIVSVICWLAWRKKLEGAPTKDTIRFDF
jgi:hypothetical protein